VVGVESVMVKMSAVTSSEAVLEAITEAEKLRRRGFLQQYGFGESPSYLLWHKNEDYES
jgi:hypothetical protein